MCTIFLEKPLCLPLANQVSSDFTGAYRSSIYTRFLQGFTGKYRCRIYNAVSRSRRCRVYWTRIHTKMSRIRNTALQVSPVFTGTNSRSRMVAEGVTGIYLTELHDRPTTYTSGFFRFYRSLQG